MKNGLVIVGPAPSFLSEYTFPGPGISPNISVQIRFLDTFLGQFFNDLKKLGQLRA